MPTINVPQGGLLLILMASQNNAHDSTICMLQYKGSSRYVIDINKLKYLNTSLFRLSVQVPQ